MMKVEEHAGVIAATKRLAELEQRAGVAKNELASAEAGVGSDKLVEVALIGDDKALSAAIDRATLRVVRAKAAHEVLSRSIPEAQKAVAEAKRAARREIIEASRPQDRKLLRDFLTKLQACIEAHDAHAGHQTEIRRTADEDHQLAGFQFTARPDLFSDLRQYAKDMPFLVGDYLRQGK